MIKVSAPGRCGLLGSPSDMYGGSIISCSISQQAHCVIDTTWLGPGLLLQASGLHHQVQTNAELGLRGDALDIARTVIGAFDIDPQTSQPFLVSITSDIPVRAGLADETAIASAVVGAILAHLELRLSLYEIAELTHKIERDARGRVFGFHNHYMCAFGGLNYLDFRDKGADDSQDPGAPFVTVEPLDPHISGSLPLLVAHSSADDAQDQVHTVLRERWLAGDPSAAAGYERMAQFARLGKKAILAGRWDTVGQLMNSSHGIERDFGGGSAAAERLIETALSCGCPGAKVVDSHHGATIVAVTFDTDRTASALQHAGATTILTPIPRRGLTVEILV